MCIRDRYRAVQHVRLRLRLPTGNMWGSSSTCNCTRQFAATPGCGSGVTAQWRQASSGPLTAPTQEPTAGGGGYGERGLGLGRLASGR
eukprot:8880346-Lingulodinium_polyedra.AAC.1